ncbi:phosphotransferase [Clostridium sp.]|uniref:phosphotransferase n=1 Tax=Clostridium sp. TaxID=1506 RepID=UPI003F35D81B
MTSLNVSIETNEIKYIVQKLYGIFEPFNCTFIRRSFNDHYLIQTQNKKYILRVYLNNKYYINDINDFNCELELLYFLMLKNMPVSYPIKNKDNLFLSKVILNNELRFIAMFSFAEGSPLTSVLEDDLAINLGKNIADLHKTFDEFSSKYNRYKINIDYLIKEPIEMLRKYAVHYELDNLSFFIPYEKYLCSKLKELPINRYSYGIIHGDLNPSNIHVDEKGNIIIFDFDHCAYGWRIHDLAVVKLCYEKNTYEAILDAYILKRKLSKTEEQLIELYSNALILRKYKDILSMIKINNHCNGHEFCEKDFISSAIDTLYHLSNE